jgi:hypothetical protein
MKALAMAFVGAQEVEDFIVVIDGRKANTA